MTSTRLLNLSTLLDDAKCFALVRQHRWPDSVHCPSCGSAGVARHGRDDTQPHRQRYRCTACTARFDDLSGTALAGHHRPLRVWVLLGLTHEISFDQASGASHRPGQPLRSQTGF